MGLVIITIMLVLLYITPASALLTGIAPLPLVGIPLVEGGTRMLTLAGVLLIFAGAGWAFININSLPMIVDLTSAARIGTFTGLYYLFSTFSAIVGPNLNGWAIQLAGNNYNIIMLIAPGFHADRIVADARRETRRSTEFVNFLENSSVTISNVPTPQENTPSSSNKYVWIAVALFALLVFCASIMFCVAEIAILRGSKVGASQPETGIVTEPQKDILKEVSTDPEWKLEINDEFNDNKNKWEVGPYVGDLVTLDRSIKNGKYVMDFQSSVYWTYWSFPDTNIAEDFVASVEIKHIEGNSSEAFGFIFRSTFRDYYLFQVDENGRASFFIYTLDKYTTLMDRGTSAVKIGEANEVTVHAEGSHFIFYVNGSKVGEIDDDRLPNGFVGVVTSTSGIPGPVPNVDFSKTQQQCISKFEVDNFKLWIPRSGYTKLDVLTPDKGRIVFVSDKDGNPEIYSINSDGTDPDRLTNNIADDYLPKWSSDGSKIAFVSTRDGNPEIYIMNVDGTGITRVTDNSSDDLDPAWSPDGKEIVFSSNRDGNYEIYIHNLEADKTEQLTEDTLSEDRYPEWSAKEDQNSLQIHTIWQCCFLHSSNRHERKHARQYTDATKQYQPPGPFWRCAKSCLRKRGLQRQK